MENEKCSSTFIVSWFGFFVFTGRLHVHSFRSVEWKFSHYMTVCMLIGNEYTFYQPVLMSRFCLLFPHLQTVVRSNCESLPYLFLLAETKTLAIAYIRQLCMCELLHYNRIFIALCDKNKSHQYIIAYKEIIEKKTWIESTRYTHIGYIVATYLFNLFSFPIGFNSIRCYHCLPT